MRGQEGLHRGGVSVLLAGVLREEPEDQIFEVRWQVVAE